MTSEGSKSLATLTSWKNWMRCCGSGCTHSNSITRSCPKQTHDPPFLLFIRSQPLIHKHWGKKSSRVSTSTEILAVWTFRQPSMLPRTFIADVFNPTAEAEIEVGGLFQCFWESKGLFDEMFTCGIIAVRLVRMPLKSGCSTCMEVHSYGITCHVFFVSIFIGKANM